MAKAMQRILRIRQLAEQQARREVERAAQRAQQASAACARQITLEHQQRTTLSESWIHRPDTATTAARAMPPGKPTGESAEERGWLMEEAVLEFFGWRRMRLEQLREAELRRMEPLVEEYRERRRELRQTEQLVELQARTAAMEKNRKLQAATDEWFSQRTLRKRRRELHRAQVDRTKDLGGEPSVSINANVVRQF